MAVPPLKPIRAVHKNDIEWIIELWLRIHGGDPVPDQINRAAIDIIRGVSAHLNPAQSKAVAGALQH